MLALFLSNLARAQEEENAVGHGLPLSQGLQRFFYAGIESPELEKKAQGKFFYETGSALPGTMGMRWVRFP